MSIATEITRLNNAKASIKSAIEAKGVEVPQDAKIDIYADYIAQIPQGGGTEYEPICFASLEDGNTFKLNKEISISVDGKKTWQTLAANTPSPVINTGEKIYFRAVENTPAFAGTTSDYYKFTTSKTCNVSGHPYSLYTKGSFYFFANLFNGTNIVDASGLTLEEEIVSNGCYQNMFRDCSSLVTAPELPATTLSDYCYASMFYGCTSLTTVTTLPATTLAVGCYNSMFYGCVGLTTAPELPATTLISGCYTEMFRGCSSLNYIKALFTTEPSSSYTSNWVLGVAATGTFVKSTKATWTTIGVNGVPEGWTVKVEWEKQYLTFIPVTNTIFTWTQKSVSGHLEYSVNGGQTWVNIADGGSTPTITAGSKVIWRGDLKPNTNSTDVGGIGTFSASGNYNAYGNTMSLLYYSSYYNKQLDSATDDFAFNCLFYNDTHLLTAPILPSITLTTFCYYKMFRGCTSLTTAPELPAMTLANSCYYQMFMGCKSLTTAPTLPATKLASSCYQNMFFNCSSLVTAPELPAMTLASNCYYQMFRGCTSLTIAPELPATTLADFCYNSMFYGCTSLVTAPTLPAMTLANSCYYRMFYGCKSLTTAPTLPATKLASSCYFGMFSYCSSLVTAPTLPATTLVENCYPQMFYSCLRLNYIKALFTTKPSATYTESWVYGVSSTGKFVKNSAATWTTIGVNGVPEGWTVVNDNA